MLYLDTIDRLGSQFCTLVAYDTDDNTIERISLADLKGTEGMFYNQRNHATVIGRGGILNTECQWIIRIGSRIYGNNATSILLIEREGVIDGQMSIDDGYGLYLSCVHFMETPYYIPVMKGVVPLDTSIFYTDNDSLYNNILRIRKTANPVAFNDILKYCPVEIKKRLVLS